MLTLPDFKEKKILFVESEYNVLTQLKLINDNIEIKKDNVVTNKVSIHILIAIFVIGDLNITTSLIKKLVSNGINIFFLNYNFETKASIGSSTEGNFLLREKQYLQNNDLEIAKNLVKNKAKNQKETLKKLKLKFKEEEIDEMLKKIDLIENREVLLGIEGSIAKEYFQNIFKKYKWYRRCPQAKEDITNFLLDIGYTYLFNYCDSLLKLFGFDTYKGCYHQLFFQRKSLVCDIMEPIRPIIDKQIVKSYNLSQINEKDFIFKNGRYEFKDGFKSHKKYSSIFLETISNNKEEIYNFILKYYRYNMDPLKYKFPNFKV